MLGPEALKERHEREVAARPPQGDLCVLVRGALRHDGAWTDLLLLHKQPGKTLKFAENVERIKYEKCKESCEHKFV